MNISHEEGGTLSCNWQKLDVAGAEGGGRGTARYLEPSLMRLFHKSNVLEGLAHGRRNIFLQKIIFSSGVLGVFVLLAQG